MKELVLRNAHVVTPDAVFRGGLLLRNGVIDDVSTGAMPTGDGSFDMEGDYLLPGLVEVHTDSLERALTPRPGVLWPEHLAAALANDALLEACGILTVLDAICAEAFPREEMQRELFRAAVSAVMQGVQAGLFRARHLLHLRCETADPAVLDMVTPYIDSPLVRLVSLMDHTPGQRQYRNLQKYREYYSREGWTDQEFQEVLMRRKELQARYAGAHRTEIIAMCKRRGIAMASHDDASLSHVEQAKAEGARICEFPTTLEAALAARERGLYVLMGAPNCILGHSHAGNVSALDVLEAGALDILSSDYAPYSLLAAPFQLHAAGMPLYEAVRLVSVNPANALDLADVGRILPGARGDVLRVRLHEGAPVVVKSWKG